MVSQHRELRRTNRISAAMLLSRVMATCDIVSIIHVTCKFILLIRIKNGMRYETVVTVMTLASFALIMAARAVETLAITSLPPGITNMSPSCKYVYTTICIIYYIYPKVVQVNFWFLLGSFSRTVYLNCLDAASYVKRADLPKKSKPVHTCSRSYNSNFTLYSVQVLYLQMEILRLYATRNKPCLGNTFFNNVHK